MSPPVSVLDAPPRRRHGRTPPHEGGAIVHTQCAPQESDGVRSPLASSPPPRARSVPGETQGKVSTPGVAVPVPLVSSVHARHGSGPALRLPNKCFVSLCAVLRSVSLGLTPVPHSQTSQAGPWTREECRGIVRTASTTEPEGTPLPGVSRPYCHGRRRKSLVPDLVKVQVAE